MTRPLDLHALRQRLGGDIYDGARRWSGPGPGHSRHDRSLSVYVTDEGRNLIHSFAGDSREACAHHLGIDIGPSYAGQTFPASLQALRKVRWSRGREQTDGALLAFRLDMWGGRLALPDTPAEAYLIRRGLAGPFPAALAFHPSAPLAYGGGVRLPVLLAPVQDAGGELVGLHLTALTAGAKGRERRMFGPVGGGAVRLGEIGADGVLAVAEGIETALAFTQLHAIPCWAALSAPGLQTFELPPGVKRLIIAADGDEPGLTAARKLAERAAEHRDVEIHAAPPGQDFNDLLLAKLHAKDPA